MNEIRHQVREMILRQFLEGLDPSALKDDVSLERTHIVDSARSLEIILWVEETFGFTVENEDAVPENFDTVDNIAAYIERKRRAVR